jgi:uncharacterized protein (DUF1015 family)
MATLRPFRGILYDPAVVGPLDRVVAPPYDVIGAEEQGRLYEASPFNAIRLDLSRDRDRYGSAARTFQEWTASGALRRDPSPALYAHGQRFLLKDGTVHERFGVFARLRLEEFSSGKVLPHEKTLAAPKADRLELQRACRANLSPIFGLCSLPGWRLADALAPALAAPPAIAIDDRLGVRHRLWRLTDPALQRGVVERLGGATVYIADGHHRYETALRYRDEMREQSGRRSGEEPFDYVLAFLSNMDEPGLVVLPTHRLLRDLALPPGRFAERLGTFFRMEEIPRARGAGPFLESVKRPAPGERRIGVVLRDLDRFLVLATQDGDNDARLVGSTALRRLDVTLLHGLALEGGSSLLGLDAHEEAERGRLVYTKDDEEAVMRVVRGEFAAGFLLNPTRVDEVRAVCEAGETMPEKSTYFYPKLLTGLVFNGLADD